MRRRQQAPFRMEYKRGSGATHGTLPERLAAHSAGHPDAFPPRGRPPRWQRAVGDDVAILWRCLLWYVNDGGFLDRCNGPVPITATDDDHFHSRHTTKFLEACSPPWERMQVAERKQCFRDYLHRKFTTDRQGESIRPRPPKLPRKADIKWGDFHLYPREFDQLIENAFGEYCVRVGLVTRPA